VDDLERRFRDSLRKKRFDNLEGLWLELVDAGTPLPQLLVLSEVTEKWAPKKTSAVLLSVLADTLKEAGRHDDELTVLRRLTVLDPDYLNLARDLAECIAKVHADIPGLDKLLRKSGLGFGKPVPESLAMLDSLLMLSAGRIVYDPEKGAGRVEKLDLLLDRVKVVFDDGTPWESKIDPAAQRLRPARPGGYFAMLANDRAGLRALAESEPAQVAVLLLRDAGRPLTVAEMKSALSEVVDEERWNRFWESARRGLSRDSHVESLTTPARSFRWSDTPVKKETAARKRTTRRKPLPPVERLRTESETWVLRKYRELTTFTERKGMLELLDEAERDDRTALLCRLFREPGDRRTRNLIEKELTETAPGEWRKLLEDVMTGYRQSPDAFLWLLESRDRLGVGDSYGLLTRLVDILESPGHREHWNGFRAVLEKQGRAVLESALGDMELPRAQRLVGRISRLRSVEEYLRDELVSAVGVRFPELSPQGDDDVILSTEAGISSAREQLRRMTKEDLPQTAEEIARARAHGDLSENYEYKAAKEKQARLMARIDRLQTDLSRARSLSPSDVSEGEVSVGCRVSVTDEAGKSVEYTILGPWDSDPDNRIISYLAPLGKALLGRKPGETLELDERRYTVESVSPGLPG